MSNLNSIKNKRIDEKYLQIIRTKEFQELKDKNQLGLNTSPDANHKRYEHSIGVFNKADELIQICKEKFSDILTITTADEEAIKVMALVHDLKHPCFSHVSERFLEGNHEDKAQCLLLDENSEINQTINKYFGAKVLQKVLYILQMKNNEKDSKDVKNGLIFILGKLLAGGIDIDRIDYIKRDSFFLFGQVNDFTSILYTIDLEYINDSLEVVFEGENVEYTIANFFIKRFELYDTGYLKPSTRTLEQIYSKFIDRANINLTWDTPEREMKQLFKDYTSSDDLALRRYATLLSKRQLDSDILIKEINQESRFELFEEKITNAVPELKQYQEAVHKDYSKVEMYKPEYKIYIRKNGLIQDILDSNPIFDPTRVKEKFVMAIDLELLRTLMLADNKTPEEIKDVIKRVKKAMSPEIEQEKKYVFNEQSKDPKEDFKKIKDRLGLTEGKYKYNHDTYYDYNGILADQKINLRKRLEGGKEEWTLKRPLKDQTSISKREEKNFTTLEEALRFLEIEWNIELPEVQEVITLDTKRVKYTLEFHGGIFEIVFDKTTPEFNGEEYPYEYMIECELKDGKSAGLYFIDQAINGFDFIDECNQSKKERAKNRVKAATRVRELPKN